MPPLPAGPAATPLDSLPPPLVWPPLHEVELRVRTAHPGEPRRVLVSDRPSERREKGPRESARGRERAR
ncbi:hypothetical protein [Aquabacterium sp. J223]|uniref:hypothetical protein n=1 Tax=Aquabacterium sp. J223 TaxID=2898431 RepID=UPI0021AD8999|nr:hypothetical protein [Aquabacterium sp. J223]UUX94265.1 hypothetical protein LRS07_13100 [Aquabacterium sp. J223]